MSYATKAFSDATLAITDTLQEHFMPAEALFLAYWLQSQLVSVTQRLVTKGFTVYVLHRV